MLGEKPCFLLWLPVSSTKDVDAVAKEDAPEDQAHVVHGGDVGPLAARVLQVQFQNISCSLCNNLLVCFYELCLTV